MNLVLASVLAGIAAFVAGWIMFAIAARRDHMSDLVRTFAVLVVGATGITFAATYRLVTNDLSSQDKWLCAVAALLGFLWPCWKCVRDFRAK